MLAIAIRNHLHGHSQHRSEAACGWWLWWWWWWKLIKPRVFDHRPPRKIKLCALCAYIFSALTNACNFDRIWCEMPWCVCACDKNTAFHYNIPFEKWGICYPPPKSLCTTFERWRKSVCLTPETKTEKNLLFCENFRWAPNRSFSRTTTTTPTVATMPTRVHMNVLHSISSVINHHDKFNYRDVAIRLKGVWIWNHESNVNLFSILFAHAVSSYIWQISMGFSRHSVYMRDADSFAYE